jgi:subtilisin family serine protease
VFTLVLLGLCLIEAAPTRVVQAQRRAPLSGDLESLVRSRSARRQRVIVQGDAEALRNLERRHRVRVVRMLAHEAVIEANAAEVERIAADAAYAHMSGDLPVRSWMSVSNKSTAADQTREGTSGLLGLLGAISGVTGKNIGVAVIDSGIASNHKALYGKVKKRVDYVQDGSTKLDPFGHGTHIAGLIAGLASASVTKTYTGGIAPGAHLVDVRVLGADGTGLTSHVIDGIDWVINNKSTYNIRVINLSLGHAVMESAFTDPLCAAVKRAIDAKIVVVASAGNRGKTDTGQPILGGITSPGNCPHAMTVGALNTFSTTQRSDDGVTTYSSRGPTRFDHAVKPDVVAPGNKIVSLESPGSYLATAYPTTHVAGSSTNGYMRLSGTSMATGVVAGGAALLLQGNSNYTPHQIKLLLQTGSTYLVRDGLVAGGAGSVNIWSSRRSQVNGLDDLLAALPLIGGLFTQPGGAAFWDRGDMSERLYDGIGLNLLGLGELLGALLFPLNLERDTLHLVGSDSAITSNDANHIIWGDVGDYSEDNHIIWGDQLTTPEGQHIIWGDTQMTEGYHIIWGDSAGVED